MLEKDLPQLPGRSFGGLAVDHLAEGHAAHSVEHAGGDELLQVAVKPVRGFAYLFQHEDGTTCIELPWGSAHRGEDADVASA